MEDPTNAPPARSSGRLLMLAGLAVPVLGIATHVVQFSLQHLMLPS